MSLVVIPHVPHRAHPLAVLATIDAVGRRRQPLLWSAAIAMLALAVPTGAALLIDGRLLNEINVWSKPLKFEVSIAMFLATLAWFWAYLPGERRGGLLGRFATLSVVLLFVEIAYMNLQSARGVGSHFNTATAWEGIAFTLMGAASMVFTALPAALGVAIARSPAHGHAPAVRLAVVLGLILTTLLGAGAGIVISINGGHWVGAPATDAGGLPLVGWTRQGGDLRVAHFFGIHAMQILPLLGWLVARRAPNATGAVWAAAGTFTAFTAWTLVEALAGRPFLDFLG